MGLLKLRTLRHLAIEWLFLSCVTVWFKAPESKVAAKNDPAAVIKEKEVSAESLDESCDDSEDDDEIPAKVTAQKPAATGKKGPSAHQWLLRRQTNGSSGSEQSSESEDEDVVKKVEGMFQAPLMIVQRKRRFVSF
ncbi:nucleolin 1-like [Pyrus ussuriensis x Pyrus communis]|uniref:Nucleolin 1-like n=1 Tax=Pyrus ussuriensis x Pyrus communis TaxID=2448454 RepID=A0A5N5FBQ6_9ROSA|nr:nucleolin 1-like [Pyrus ussuriensis x Pyrus communis]